MDDDELFGLLLCSMGITKFDGLVLVALNEYAHRFAVELLTDAKDYSAHANKREIDVEDILLAARMSTTRIIGLDARASVAAELQREINKQDLMSIQAKDSVLLRYPHDQFMQRVHTYVPGSEAYPEASETMASIAMHNSVAQSSEDVNENFANDSHDNVGDDIAPTPYAVGVTATFKSTTVRTVPKKLRQIPTFASFS